MTHELLHATSLLIGEKVLLIRGASSSGKTQLALHFLAQHSSKNFVQLISDDQTYIHVAHERLVATAPQTISGKIEKRGFGLSSISSEACGIVRAVLDLVEAPTRLPTAQERYTDLCGIKLPRLYLRAHEKVSLLELRTLLDEWGRLGEDCA